VKGDACWSCYDAGRSDTHARTSTTTRSALKVAQYKDSESQTDGLQLRSTRQMGVRPHWLLYTTKDTIEMAERRVPMRILAWLSYSPMQLGRGASNTERDDEADFAHLCICGGLTTTVKGSVSQDGGIVEGRVMSGEHVGTRVGK